jgi:hypothetical protein
MGKPAPLRVHDFDKLLNCHCNLFYSKNALTAVGPGILALPRRGAHFAAFKISMEWAKG